VGYAVYGQERDIDALETISADYVWVNREHGTSTLLHSRLLDGEWSPAEVILDKSSGLITTPSIVRSRKKELWTFWSELHGEESTLFYRKYDGEKWSEPDQLPTDMEFNAGTAVVLDEYDAPWIFWVGNDGQDDDIYWSRWKTGEWSQPVRINEENNTPDILPIAGRGQNGKIWVVWSGFNGTRYQHYFSQWQGDHWSRQTVFSSDNPVFETVKERLNNQDILPAQVRQQAAGFIDIQDRNKTLHSFRLLPAELMQVQ